MLAPDSQFGSAREHVSRTGEEGRRTGEHGDDAEEDLFDALHGAPALAGRLVGVGVVSWRVQDRDADVTRRVDCDLSARARERGTDCWDGRGEG